MYPGHDPDLPMDPDVGMTVCLFCRSGLEQDDMRVMYKYLTTSLFPSYLEQEIHTAGSASPTKSPTANIGHYGK